MKRIVLLVLAFCVSAFANFFVLDKGKIVEIVNEPHKNVQIIGSNGKLLKKHKTLASVKRYKRDLQKKRLKRKSKKVIKKVIKKRRYTKGRKVTVKKRYKKYSKNSKYTKKKRTVKRKTSKKYVKKRKSINKRSYKKYKASTRKKQVVKKKKKKIKDLIVIRTHKRILEFYKDGRFKKLYKVAVGKDGWRSYGKFWVRKKVKWPDWIPTKRIKEENPNLPDIVYGGPKNPLGARALYLGYSSLRIHGTNNPKSVGKAVSHGCFRMKNEDIIELYSMVKIGTPVYVK